jgi:hypothetical protein
MANMAVGNESAYGVFIVSPSDTVDLTNTTRAIRATVGGVITLIGMDGVQVACAFSSGETRSIKARRILTTGTTATGIEGMY